MLATSLVMLSGQMALQSLTDVVANNIANSGTTGFKRENVAFGAMLTNQNGAEQTDYVVNRGAYRDLSAGAITSTGNPLDLAIQGSGYFQVQTAGGTKYTRDGVFRLDNQGRITTTTGQPILSDAGQPISIPDEATDINISGDGFITAQVGTGSTRAQLGKIGVVNFANAQQLQSAGGNLYTSSQTPTPVVGNPLVQGAVEASNVKPIAEMTELIRIQRAYEQANNMLSAENSRLSNAFDKLSATG